jgi:FKBP-type peptidyl-prolyl cis-trans isomerase
MRTFLLGKLRRLPVVLLWLTTAGLLTTACSKDNETVTADYSAADDATITKYLAANSITTAQKQASGLYFVPTTTNATAAMATIGKTVSVLYTGRLLDGTVFDATSQRNNVPISFVLGNSQVLPGFQEGISLMHLGDKATLLLPSALAYGPSGNSNVNVPANAVVRFDVELVDLNFALTDDALITKYVADNSITTAQKQASGLYYAPITTNPSGVQATAGKTVSVLYTGRLLNGTVFDASSQHGNVPLSFVLGRGQVIAGWDEGIALMRKGEKATLLIPSAQAYGPAGAGNGAIPANSVLRFEVELTDVQ